MFSSTLDLDIRRRAVLTHEEAHRRHAEKNYNILVRKIERDIAKKRYKTKIQCREATMQELDKLWSEFEARDWRDYWQVEQGKY